METKIDRTAYYKKYYQTHKKERLEYLHIYYYKNRDKLINKQKIYDDTHKSIKRNYDQKRRNETNKNKISVIQLYSRTHYFETLLKKYKHCQLCPEINNLQIHHKKYTKNIKDCMLLCPVCHKKIHLKRAIPDL